MIFNKKDLQSSFDRVKGVAPKSSPMQIFGTVRIVTNENCYKMSASNGVYQMTVSGKCEGDDNFDMCFPVEKFGLMLSSGNETVEIKITEGKAATKSGKSKFNLHIIDGVNFPEMKLSENPILCDGINLRHVIGKSHLCVAKNDIRVQLNGVCVSSDGKAIRSTATDGRILASNFVDVESSVFEVILPGDVIKIITSYDSDGFSVGGRRNIEITMADGSKVISKVIDDKFPAWQRVAMFESIGSFTVNGDEFKKQTSVAGNVSDTNTIVVNAGENVMKLTASGSDGSFETELEYSGDEIQTALNCSNLLTAIDIAGTNDFNLSFDANKSRFKYEKDGVLVVMTPMKA